MILFVTIFTYENKSLIQIISLFIADKSTEILQKLLMVVPEEKKFS